MEIEDLFNFDQEIFEDDDIINQPGMQPLSCHKLNVIESSL